MEADGNRNAITNAGVRVNDKKEAPQPHQGRFLVFSLPPLGQRSVGRREKLVAYGPETAATVIVLE